MRCALRTRACMSPRPASTTASKLHAVHLGHRLRDLTLVVRVQALQQQNSEAREDRAALRTAIETIQASLEQLDERCQQTEKHTEDDRVALRGLMEMVEDTMPIADAHELFEQQKIRFASEISVAHKRCEDLSTARQLDLARLDAIEQAQADAKIERDKLRTDLQIQETRSREWEATQKSLYGQCADLARQITQQKVAAEASIAELKSSHQDQLEDIVNTLDAVGKKQGELGEQLVALGLALREEGKQQSTAQASAIASLVSDIASKMTTFEHTVEQQAAATVRAEEAATVAKRVGAEARADMAAVRGHVETLASQVRTFSADLSSERHAMDEQLAIARQGNEALRNEMADVRGDVQAFKVESDARHTRAEQASNEAIAGIRDQTERFGHTVTSSQDAQAANNARVKLETETIGARVDALQVEIAKLGTQVAEAARKVTDSGRELNLRAASMQEGYDDFAEKIQAHETKVRKLLLEYTSLTATQDAKLDALSRDTTEVRREAGSAASKLEAAAEAQQHKADAMSEVARSIRAEFDRLVAQIQEGEREQTRSAEQRLAEMRQAVDRSEEKRQENMRDCEGRCKSTELEVRSQRAAADRRLAIVEREIAESTNVVMDRVHEKISEATRALEQQLRQVEGRMLEKLSGSRATKQAPLTPLTADAGWAPAGEFGSA